jgi:hypothetical protein
LPDENMFTVRYFQISRLSVKLAPFHSKIVTQRRHRRINFKSHFGDCRTCFWCMKWHFGLTKTCNLYRTICIPETFFEYLLTLIMHIISMKCIDV